MLARKKMSVFQTIPLMFKSDILCTISKFFLGPFSFSIVPEQTAHLLHTETSSLCLNEHWHLLIKIIHLTRHAINVTAVWASFQSVLYSYAALLHIFMFQISSCHFSTENDNKRSIFTILLKAAWTGDMIDNFYPSTRDNLVYHLVIMHSGVDPGHSIRLWQFFSQTWPLSHLPVMHTVCDVLINSCHTSPQQNKLLYCATTLSLSRSFIMKWYCLHSLQNVCLNTIPLSPWGFGPCSLMLMIYFSIWSYSV